MKKIKQVLSLLLTFFLVFASIPALADYQLLTVTGNPLTATSAPYLVLNGASGQSAGSVCISGTIGGSYAIEGIYPNSTAWTAPLTVVSPDGTASNTSITATGCYAFNMANMVAIRLDGTSGTGTPNATLSAGGGINRILGAGVNGGRTNVVGSSPITVSNSGNTATVGITTPLSYASGGTGNTAFSAGYCVDASGANRLATGLCGVWQLNNFTIPSVGSVVSIPTAPNEDKGFQFKQYQPLFVADGTNALVGYADATVNGSNSVAFHETAIVAGTPGATMNGYLTLSGSGASVAPTVSVQAGSNTTVATPSPGVFVVSAVTPSPPTINAGAGIAVATPSAGVYNVSLQTPVSVANGGRGNTVATAGLCDDAQSSTVFETTNCAQWAVQSFVAPAVGSTVTITTNEGKLFNVKRYTPIFISDGTTAIQGYANATVTNSSTVVLLETNVDQGSAGNTLAANSLLSLSGLGSTGLSGLTAGTNIIITPTNPAKPTIAVNSSPTFTSTTTSDLLVGAQGTGSIATGLRMGSYVGTAGQTLFLPCPSGNVTAECVASGVTASVFNVATTAPGIAASYLAEDASGDVGVYGSLYTTNLYTGTKGGTAGTVGSVNTAHVVAATDITDSGLTSGRCVQTTTGGLLTVASAACGSGSGTVTSVTAGSNIVIGGTGASPSVAVTSAPTFSGRVTSNDATVSFYTGVTNMTRSYVAQNNVTGAGNSNLGPSPSVTIAGVTANVWNFSEYDGNSLVTNLAAIDSSGDVGTAGYVASGTLTSGKCLQATTNGRISNAAGGSCPTTYQGGTILGGTHIEVGVIASIPASSTKASAAFGTTYSSTPTCTVTTTGDVLPQISIDSTSTTTVTAYNGSATTAYSANFMCVGN